VGRWDGRLRVHGGLAEKDSAVGRHPAGGSARAGIGGTKKRPLDGLVEGWSTRPVGRERGPSRRGCQKSPPALRTAGNGKREREATSEISTHRTGVAPVHPPVRGRCPEQEFLPF